VRNTTTPQRTKPSQERRDDLMNAAQLLFLDKGASTTTVEDITTGAGVAKGTFYLYFTSKEHVLGALRERFARELVRKLDDAVAKAPKKRWDEKLAAWASTCAAVYFNSRRLHEAIFHESRPPSAEGLTDNLIVDHLTRLLEAGSAAKAWSVDDPRNAALFLFSGLHGVAGRPNANQTRADRNAVTQHLERLFFAAVGLGRAPA
jgi:AcrR family transcriptional regulator